jgi:hypothetical protein
MKSIKSLAIITSIITATLSACSTTQQTIELEDFVSGSCVFKEAKEQAPDWFCAPDEMFPQGSWYQKGSGHQSLGDENLQRTVAMQSARIKLARRVSALAKSRFEESIKTDGMANAQYSEISRDIVNIVETELDLPPTFRSRETFDSLGNFHVLIKVDENKLYEKVKEKENKMMRLFNAQLKQKSISPPIQQNEKTTNKNHPTGEAVTNIARTFSNLG